MLNGPSGFDAFILTYIENLPSPEPSTFALAGFGLASLWFFRRRGVRG
jgi:hypothetical protein